MLKNLTHIILSFVLLVSTTGVTISKHYCCDRLISVSFYSEADPCCDDEGGCCDNKTETYQVEDDFTAAEYQIIEQVEDFKVLYTIVLLQFFFEPISDSYIDIETPESPPPPTQQEFLSRIQTYLC